MTRFSTKTAHQLTGDIKIQGFARVSFVPKVLPILQPARLQTTKLQTSAISQHGGSFGGGVKRHVS